MIRAVTGLMGYLVQYCAMLSEGPGWLPGPQQEPASVGGCVGGMDVGEEGHSRNVPASSVIVQLDGQVTLTLPPCLPGLPEAF